MFMDDTPRIRANVTSRNGFVILPIAENPRRRWSLFLFGRKIVEFSWFGLR